MLSFTPLFDRILVKPLPEEQKIGGIIIPGTSNTLKYGTVIAAGPGRAGVPMSIKEGQTVAYQNEGVIDKPTIDGQQYLLLNERDIFLASV